MELNIKTLAIGAVVLLGVGASIGRYATPSKVVTKTEIQVVEKEKIKYKESKSKDLQKDKETVIVEITLPDGTVRKEKRIVDKSKSQTEVNKDLNKETETTVSQKTETTVTNKTGDWQIAVLAAPKANVVSALSGDLSYGLHIQKRIIGPFSVGVFGLTTKTFGLSIGGSF